MRALVITDGLNMPSGYARLASALLAGTPAHHEIGFASFQLPGGPVEYQGHPVYSAFTQERIDWAITDFAPDVVLVIRDLFTFTPEYFSMAFSLPRDVRGAIYTAVHSSPLPLSIRKKAMKSVDCVIVPTEWSRGVVTEIGIPWNRTFVVTPATTVTREKKKRTKKKIILSVGVHDDYRKAWPILIKAFERVYTGEEELWLKTASGAYSLQDHINATNVPDDAVKILPYDKLSDRPIPWSLATAYASSSIAEGINMPAMEALIQGIRPVIGNHPNHLELFPDSIFASTARIYPSLWGFDWIPDIHSFARGLFQALETPRDGKLAARYWEKFSPERFGSGVFGVLEAVLRY